MIELQLELVPGKGALPLKLGVKRDEIRLTMADLGHEVESTRGSIDYFIRSSIQVEFDDENLASFIGISTSSEIDLIYHGAEILHLPSQEVFELIKAREPNSAIEYSSDEHLFRSQIITLWDADEQYDHDGERFPVWAQIGIGIESYLKAVS